MSTLSVLESTFFPDIMSCRFLSTLYIALLTRTPNLIADDQVYVERCSEEDVSASDVSVSGSKNRDLKLVTSVLLEQSSDSESC